MELQELADKIDHFQDDFTDHKIEDKEWKAAHEKADHLAFDEFKAGLQGLYTAQKDTVTEIRALREDMKYGRWLFDGSKGLSLIPKGLYLTVFLIAMLVIFGFKAVFLFVIDLFKP